MRDYRSRSLPCVVEAYFPSSRAFASNSLIRARSVLVVVADVDAARRAFDLPARFLSLLRHRVGAPVACRALIAGGAQNTGAVRRQASKSRKTDSPTCAVPPSPAIWYSALVLSLRPSAIEAMSSSVGSWLRGGRSSSIQGACRPRGSPVYNFGHGLLVQKRELRRKGSRQCLQYADERGWMRRHTVAIMSMQMERLMSRTMRRSASVEGPNPFGCPGALQPPVGRLPGTFAAVFDLDQSWLRGGIQSLFLRAGVVCRSQLISQSLRGKVATSILFRSGSRMNAP